MKKLLIDHMSDIFLRCIADFSHTSQADKSVQEVEAALAVETDYQALTNKEEMDLETLMSQCDFAISNAESFAEQLAGDLSVLDGVNMCISATKIY